MMKTNEYSNKITTLGNKEGRGRETEACRGLTGTQINNHWTCRKRYL
jgi:hypothetical protein